MSSSQFHGECGIHYKNSQMRRKRTVSKSLLVSFLVPAVVIAAVSYCYSIRANISSRKEEKAVHIKNNHVEYQGLTYQLYDNAALFGDSPIYNGTTLSAHLSLEPPNEFGSPYSNSQRNNSVLSFPQIFSGSLTGSLEVIVKEESERKEFENDDEENTNDWYVFDCTFDGTATGWVRVGSHLVCHDGNAYSYQQDVMVHLLPGRRYAFHARITTNSTTDDTHTDGGSTKTAPNLSIYWKKASERKENAEASHREPKNGNQRASNPLERGFRKLSFANEMGNPFVFHPDLPSTETKRQELNSRVARGWGHWLLPDILSLTKLPEGLVIGLQICGNNGLEDCVGPVVPDSNGIVRVDKHTADRSYTSFNLTFVSSEGGSVSLTIETSAAGSEKEELRCLITVNNCDSSEGFVLQIAPRYAWFRPGMAITNDDPSLLFSTPGFDDIGVRLLQENQVTEESALSNFQQETSLVISLPGKEQKVGLIAAPSATLIGNKESLSDLEQHIRLAENLDDAAMKEAFGPKYEVAQAIRAAVMWSCVYNPIEEGPFMPVSRSSQWAATFADKAGAATPDWTYVIFEWDNLFASLMASLFDKDIAYSNLFVSLRSKTPDGFLPNWSTAGGIRSSADRTEPPVGAKILLELYKKFKDEWIVEALWEDLVDWNDWFVRERVLQPVELIVLGSNQEHGNFIGDIQNNMQAARYESGLDNSPMYDGDENLLYDKNSHTMQIYDVGMSALVANEAYCLSQLLRLVDFEGKHNEKAQLLQNRGNRLRDNIFKHLWDADRKIFANRYRKFLPGTNTSFVRSITPTSFYPLLLPLDSAIFKNNDILANVDSQSTIESMIDSWLLNATRFCLSPHGDFQGNDPNKCYWGLPSVSADDPTYMATGQWNYWRGRVWGPMAQIVFWSLQGTPEELILPSKRSRYSNENRKLMHAIDSQGSLSRTITKARKSLCAQMQALLMSQWETNRHICENYSPFKNATECSGTLFYHWGALNGMIGIIEDGYF